MNPRNRIRIAQAGIMLFLFYAACLSMPQYICSIIQVRTFPGTTRGDTMQIGNGFFVSPCTLLAPYSVLNGKTVPQTRNDTAITLFCASLDRKLVASIKFLDSLPLIYMSRAVVKPKNAWPAYARLLPMDTLPPVKAAMYGYAARDGGKGFFGCSSVEEYEIEIPHIRNMCSLIPKTDLCYVAPAVLNKMLAKNFSGAPIVDKNGRVFAFIVTFALDQTNRWPLWAVPTGMYLRYLSKKPIPHPAAVQKK